MKEDPAEFLFSLIQSLTPSEKRYVRIFATRHLSEESSFLLPVYDGICKLKIPSDDNLAAQLPKEIARKQIPALKSKLYRLILKSMRLFHEERSVKKQLRDRMDNAEFLFVRRLYAPAMRELSRAKDLARKFEYWTILLDVLRFEQDVIMERYAKNVEKELQVIDGQIAEAEQNIKVEIAIQRLRKKTVLLFRARSLADTAEIVQKCSGLLNEAEQVVSEKEGLRVDTTRWFIQATCAQCCGDYSLAASAYHKILSAWEANPHRLHEESITYKKMLANYMTICHAMNDLEKIPPLLARTRAIPCRNAEEEAEEFQNVYFMELLYLINTDGFENLPALVHTIDAGLKKYKTKINMARLLMFYYNISIAYFAIENWKESYDWIAKIINIEKTDHRRDVQAFARLFRLVHYYQLDKHDLLDYELINVERYLRSRKAWFAYEASIVKFFGKLITSGDKERKGLFEKFYACLNEFSGSGNTPAMPGITELKIWTKHRLEGKRIRDLLKEKQS